MSSIEKTDALIDALIQFAGRNFMAPHLKGQGVVAHITYHDYQDYSKSRKYIAEDCQLKRVNNFDKTQEDKVNEYELVSLYEIASINCYIKDEYACITYVYGPLFGRGYIYNIEKYGDVYEFTNETERWIS